MSLARRIASAFNPTKSVRVPVPAFGPAPDAFSPSFIFKHLRTLHAHNSFLCTHLTKHPGYTPPSPPLTSFLSTGAQTRQLTSPALSVRLVGIPQLAPAPTAAAGGLS